MQSCTAVRPALLVLTLLVLTLGALSACGAMVIKDDDQGTSASASTSGGGGSDPKTCDLTEGPIALVAEQGNAPSCQPSMTCSIWFGHGQHLSCPELGAAAADEYAACDIWDCICVVKDAPGFTADFSTGEVIDARDPFEVCRYRLEALDADG